MFNTRNQGNEQGSGETDRGRTLVPEGKYNGTRLTRIVTLSGEVYVLRRYKSGAAELEQLLRTNFKS